MLEETFDEILFPPMVEVGEYRHSLHVSVHTLTTGDEAVVTLSADPKNRAAFSVSGKALATESAVLDWIEKAATVAGRKLDAVKRAELRRLRLTED